MTDSELFELDHCISRAELDSSIRINLKAIKKPSWVML